MSEAVAKGSLVLSLDAQQLNNGLKQAANKAKAQGSEVAKNFKQSSNEQLGSLFGGNSIIASGAKAGVIGAAVAGVAALGVELWSAVDPAKALNKEFERSRELGARWLEGVDTRLSRMREALAEFNNVAATSEGLDALRTDINRLTRESSGLHVSMEEARREVEKWKNIWNKDADGEVFGNFLLGQRGRIEGEMQQRLNDAKAAYEKTRKELDGLRRRERLLMNPEENPEARTALREFIRSQTDAVANLTRTTEEAALAQLKLRYGFTDAQLGAAQAAVEMRRVAEATHAAGEWINELSQEVGVFGLAVKRTADDIKLDELVKKGIDQAQITRIRQLIQWRERLNETYKPLTGLQRGTAADINDNNRRRFEDNRNAEVAKEQQAFREMIQWLQRIALGIAGIPGKSPQI